MIQRRVLDIRPDYLAFGRPSFTAAEEEAVTRVLRSGWVGMGPETIAFEEELQAFLGAGYVVTVNSCTSALFLSLLVNGVGEDDEVICPSFTWCSTANAALYLGARPVFCDISPDTLCATAADVRAVLTNRTKAVIVVHFGGQAADVDAIRAVLPAGVALVEDAAHAFGARYADGTAVGSNGNLTCFSFYANKNLSTGEGGAVAVDDAAMAERLRSLRHLGLNADAWRRFTEPRANVRVGPAELGYKMNFCDIQAAIGRVQLMRYRDMWTRRMELAEVYATGLNERFPGAKIQHDILGSGHARHLFSIRLPSAWMGTGRDAVLSELRHRNIGASIHYPPLHEMSLYGSERADLPVTDAVASCCLTLPMSAAMEPGDAVYVLEHLADVVGSYESHGLFEESL